MSADYLEIIADDKDLVTYRPKLNTLTGGVCGTILLQQILHLWKNSKRKPFYKFFTPCQHAFYREGDSWSETLGMTWHEIHTALDKFAVKVKPGDDKTTYLETHLILYWTDHNRLTWFQVNEALLQAKLAALYAPPPNLKSVISKSENVELRNSTISEPLITETTETLKQQKGDSPKVENPSSKPNVYAAYNRAFGEPIANPTSVRTLNAVEDLEEFSAEFIDEAFLRTSKRERAANERWKEYQRFPYALQLMNEWKRADGIQPEQKPFVKPTYPARREQFQRPAAAQPRTLLPVANHDAELRAWAEARQASNMPVPPHILKQLGMTT